MSSLFSELEQHSMVMPDNSKNNLTFLKELYCGRNKIVGSNKVVFILFDALGYNSLIRLKEKYGQISDFLGNAVMEKRTTLAPSTTNSVLSSFDSGLSVSEHCVVGMTMPIKEIGVIIRVFEQCLANDKNVKFNVANITFPEPVLLNELIGKSKTVFITDEIVRKSPYTTRMLGDRAKTMTFTDMTDMMAKISAAINSGEHDFIHVYYGDLDKVQHAHCPDSKEAEELILKFLLNIKKHICPLLDKQGYKLVIVSDHGQIGTGEKDAVVINNTDPIMKYLNSPPWDGPRITFFSANKTKEFEDCFSRNYSKKFLLYESDELMKSGLFGKGDVPVDLRYRFGTHIAIPLGKQYVNYVYPGAKPWGSSKYGYHGGLLEDEMYVPIIIL